MLIIAMPRLLLFNSFFADFILLLALLLRLNHLFSCCLLYIEVIFTKSCFLLHGNLCILSIDLFQFIYLTNRFLSSCYLGFSHCTIFACCIVSSHDLVTSFLTKKSSIFRFEFLTNSFMLFGPKSLITH
jgi:hypothetical protein